MVNPADPGAGEPAGIRSVAATRSAKAAELRRVHSVVTSAQDAVSGSLWSGQSQVAFLSAMSSVTPDLLLLADGLDAQASALQSYAGQVQQIKDQQAALTFQRAQAQSVLDAAQSKLNASHTLDDRVVAQERATGNDVRTDGILRTRAHLSDRIDHQRSALRAVDAQWDDLVAWRRRVDSACAAALTGQGVLGRTSVFSGGAIRTHTPQQLLTMLAGLSVTDLQALLKAHPELAGELAKADPNVVAAWWNSLGGPNGSTSDAQTALIAGIPTIIGALNGVAWTARFAANKLNISAAMAADGKKISALQDQISALKPGREEAVVRAVLEGKIAALRTRDGIYSQMVGRQVLLFDPSGNGRYAEVHGNLNASTRNVGVIVNGTTLSMDTVLGYDKRAATFQGQSQKHGDDSLVTVTWMGGDFPDWGTYANIPAAVTMVSGTGDSLAGFMGGVHAVTNARTVVIGHSAGGAIVGAAEKAGMSADAIVQVESAGAGPGVHTVNDYAHPQVPQYTMTASDDPIRLVQGALLGYGPFGANTADLAGVTVLDAGPAPLGDVPFDWPAHDDVFNAGTPSWFSMYHVLTGVTPHSGMSLAPGTSTATATTTEY